MKIWHLFFIYVFAFAAFADDTNAPSSRMMPVRAFVGDTYAPTTNHIVLKYVGTASEKIAGLWFELVDAMPIWASPSPPTGCVVVEFRILPDGHVVDLKTISTNGIDQRLFAPCKRAILDSAPFASWPVEMRQICTNGYCVIHFPFAYR